MPQGAVLTRIKFMILRLFNGEKILDQAVISYMMQVNYAAMHRH